MCDKNVSDLSQIWSYTFVVQKDEYKGNLLFFFFNLPNNMFETNQE